MMIRNDLQVSSPDHAANGTPACRILIWLAELDFFWCRAEQNRYARLDLSQFKCPPVTAIGQQAVGTAETVKA